MEKDSMSLRQKVIAVLTQRGEPMTYRDLTDTLWATYPDFREHMLGLKSGNEREARADQRVRLGMLVRDSGGVFTATKSENLVLVGLAASEIDTAEDADDEDAEERGVSLPSVYWYTFPAYKRAHGEYPIKIGRGNDPQTRIGQQVTAMPEKPDVLGTYVHNDVINLERALHSILTLRGKRKVDAPGAEWFVTTPEEIRSLINLVLEKEKSLGRV